ncbi:DUF3376 domain-containing protein [Streptomyces sp. NPDC006326]|uniref:DUF3376 domain-containing protein n=1 Tax=Streptomyces sp. NPDC006326 TaxID=3156752 RepID=UPI0033A134A5
MSDDRPAPRSTALRLALAMRGGVTLATWTGGACCETAALRAAAGRAPGPDAALYPGLLKACGYEDVDIDVLVGTSAGAVNGVLLACHLVYGMPFGRGVRDLWLRLGDLEGLLRRSTPFHAPASLLRGDEVFYRELRSALGTLVDEAPPGWRPPASLRLILTATRLRPRPDRVHPTHGGPLPVGRSTATFRFRHRGALTDFPHESTGTARETALDRLAYAARTSSSFPGVFEPGRVYVANGSRPVRDPLPVDMRGVSSETGHPDEDPDGCVELMDGGLPDALPVAWAVRAVAEAPVPRRADRRLLLLQPVPPFPPPAEPGSSRRVTRLVRTAAKTLAAKAGAESLRGDALALRAAEAAARQRPAVAAVLPPTLAGLYDAGWARLGTYRRTVGGAEALRLIRLLADPAEVTGPDVLPLPAGPGPLDALDERADEGSASLFARLRAAGEELAVGPGTLPAPGHSPLALARTVELLMDWVQAYESGGAPVDAELVAELHERLNACRFAIATLIAARDRLLLADYRTSLLHGLLPADVTAPYAAAGRWLDAFDPPPSGATAASWEAWAVGLVQAVTGGPAPAAPARAPGEGADCSRELWERLADLAEEIGGRLPPGTEGFEALHQAAAGTGPPMADALAFAEVLLGPLRPDPLAETAGIGFHTVSAAHTGWATRTLLQGASPASPEVLVRAKLSGGRLDTFAASLSARWRMSDWTWGRLDGAASLVGVVASDERLAAAFGEDSDLATLGQDIEAALAPGPRFTALWAADVTGNPGAARWDRVRGVLTAVRQHEILDEELPFIAALHARGFRGGNRPPDPPPDPPPLRTQAAFDAAMDSFRAVGAEDVGLLLRARDPRRAVLRAGLLAWPAPQPTGKAGARLVQGVLGVLKPLVCLPLLCAVLAPAAALTAVALMWTGVAFSTGRWSSLPAHIPLCLHAMTALAAAPYRRGAPAGPRRAPYVLLLAGPPVALWQLRGLTTPGLAPRTCTLVVGAAFALAAAALLYAGTERWLLLPAATLAAGVIAALVQAGRCGLGGWWAALILYAVLAWVTSVLPRPAARPGPGRRGPGRPSRRSAPFPRLG